MKWENITVRDNQYVKIGSVKITIPLNNSSDEIKFKTNDAELIHIAINQNAIATSWDWAKWCEHFKKVLLHKNIPTTAKCLFEDWNCYCVTFEIADFKECSIAEKETYIYEQRDKQFEFQNGNTAYANKKYSYLSAFTHDLLKPYITAQIN